MPARVALVFAAMASAVVGSVAAATAVAVQGLDGPLGVGAGVTFLGFLGILFTLLVSALTKTGNRADAINKQITAAKDAELERQAQAHAEERADWDRREKALIAERDLWFSRWDAIAGPGRGKQR